ncbi:hypothetical protein RB195_002442 [Necator americanus]|uniref:Peptidase A1 domain-containing protein n=1 Tax=Necator americanus TaxID=51031 RepID=A0ABR1DJ25_NECAM
MIRNVFLLLTSSAACFAFQTPLIWKESKKIEMIRNGKYSDYSKNMINLLRSTQTPDLPDIKVYEFDYEYGQNITIGRPGQPFFVWVTTFSSMLWVPHNDCNTGLCIGKRKFTPAKSKTFVPVKEQWEAPGYGGRAKGERLGTDEVQLGGEDEDQLLIRRTAFGLATQVDSVFKETPFDGALGLAFSVYDEEKGEPFITNAINKEALREPLFSVWLASRKVGNGEPGGAITYGALDNYNCDPVFQYENISSDVFYQFKIDGVSLREFKRERSEEAMLHFSNSIRGPTAIIEELAKTAGALPIGENGFYYIDCENNFPPLQITVGPTVYSIENDKLRIKVEDGYCLLALSPADEGPTFGSSAWYFGIPLMRQYCTVFDVEKRRIGFAKPIPDETKSSTTARRSTIRSTKSYTGVVPQMTTPSTPTTSGGRGLLLLFSCIIFPIFLHCFGFYFI